MGNKPVILYNKLRRKLYSLDIITLNTVIIQKIITCRMIENVAKGTAIKSSNAKTSSKGDGNPQLQMHHFKSAWQQQSDSSSSQVLSCVNTCTLLPRQPCRSRRRTPLFGPPGWRKWFGFIRQMRGGAENGLDPPPALSKSNKALSKNRSPPWQIAACKSMRLMLAGPLSKCLLYSDFIVVSFLLDFISNGVAKSRPLHFFGIGFKKPPALITHIL